MQETHSKVYHFQTSLKGEEMAKAMNAGYDAMAVGNHEFDFGYDQLKKLRVC